MEINEIFKKYTAGEIPLEELNEALKELGVVMYHLDPEKNTIHPGEEEIYGSLSDGFGTDEKVKVINDENGIRLEYPVFDPASFVGCALPIYEVEYKGVWYRVADDGFTLK